MKLFFIQKGKERLLSMVEGRPDWCVSRQRVWGVPLPIFINKKTKEPLRDQKVIDRIAQFMKNKDLIVGLQMIQKFF
jgi:isoleucyl-tRNA synthetase